MGQNLAFYFFVTGASIKNCRYEGYETNAMYNYFDAASLSMFKELCAVGE